MILSSHEVIYCFTSGTHIEYWIYRNHAKNTIAEILVCFYVLKLFKTAFVVFTILHYVHVCMYLRVYIVISSCFYIPEIVFFIIINTTTWLCMSVWALVNMIALILWFDDLIYSKIYKKKSQGLSSFVCTSEKHSPTNIFKIFLDIVRR